MTFLYQTRCKINYKRGWRHPGCPETIVKAWHLKNVLSRKDWSKTQILYKDKVEVRILVHRCAIKGVGYAQGYPKRFVKVDISKKLSDATLKNIWFFLARITPSANNYMLGCLDMIPWDSQNALRENGHAFRPTPASKNAGLGFGGPTFCFVFRVIVNDLS